MKTNSKDFQKLFSSYVFKIQGNYILLPSILLLLLSTKYYHGSIYDLCVSSYNITIVSMHVSDFANMYPSHSTNNIWTHFYRRIVSFKHTIKNQDYFVTDNLLSWASSQLSRLCSAKETKAKLCTIYHTHRAGTQRVTTRDWVEDLLRREKGRVDLRRRKRKVEEKEEEKVLSKQHRPNVLMLAFNSVQSSWVWFGTHEHPWHLEAPGPFPEFKVFKKLAKSLQSIKGEVELQTKLWLFYFKALNPYSASHLLCKSTVDFRGC